MAFDLEDLLIGEIRFEQVDSGFSEDIYWSFSVTNQSQSVISGMDAEVRIFVTDRPVPVVVDWAYLLRDVPGGLLPWETIEIADRIMEDSLMDRLGLSPDNMRAEILIHDVGDVGGYSLLCKTHPRLLADGYLGRLSPYDGPSPLVCDTSQ